MHPANVHAGNTVCKWQDSEHRRLPQALNLPGDVPVLRRMMVFLIPSVCQFNSQLSIFRAEANASSLFDMSNIANSDSGHDREEVQRCRPRLLPTSKEPPSPRPCSHGVMVDSGTHGPSSPWFMTELNNDDMLELVDCYPGAAGCPRINICSPLTILSHDQVISDRPQKQPLSLSQKQPRSAR